MIRQKHTLIEKPTTILTALKNVTPSLNLEDPHLSMAPFSKKIEEIITHQQIQTHPLLHHNAPQFHLRNMIITIKKSN